ncbi:hypothetical protein HK101_011186 [Irineochytrium annulatum]|nr:hypothetical protein HK101_011186 [Irineochytrium annulatum]
MSTRSRPRVSYAESSTDESDEEDLLFATSRQDIENQGHGGEGLKRKKETKRLLKERQQAAEAAEEGDTYKEAGDDDEHEEEEDDEADAVDDEDERGPRTRPRRPPKTAVISATAAAWAEKMARAEVARAANDLNRPRRACTSFKKTPYTIPVPVKKPSAPRPRKVRLWKVRCCSNAKRTLPAYFQVELPPPPPVMERAVIDEEHIQRRDHFLWHYRGLFLPLLPEEKNFFMSTTNPAFKATNKIVPYNKDIEQPKTILATMKSYQLQGLAFLAHLVDNGMNGILADEMGLGKTLQTISMFAYIKESGKGGPFLVVCPLSVLSSWEFECRKWCPTLSVLRMHGPARERATAKLRANREHFDVYLTTYEQFTAEGVWFKNRKTWSVVVLDEGHKIKNDKTQVSNALFGIPTRNRFILTGTPLQNNLHELWSLLYWLYPNVFTAQTADFFIHSFDLTKGTYNIGAMDNARKLLEKIMLRRVKAQIELNIPPREEITVYLPLTKMQKFWYKRLLTKMSDQALEEIFIDKPADGRGSVLSNKSDPSTGDEVELDLEAGDSLTTADVMQHAMKNDKSGAWRRLMNLMIQLRKVCDHPYILPDAEPEPFINGDHMIETAAKFIFLEKLLPAKIKNDHRVLIFTQYTKMLDLIEDFLNYRGFRYARLDGSTARPRRNLDIRLFQKKQSPYDIFIISTKAGGLGINLTSADTVIMIDSDFNPQNDLQAMARCHRIGQTKVVTIYRLIMQSTVEEQMLTRIQKKLFLSLKVTATDASAADESEPTLTKDDLLVILRYGSGAVIGKTDDARDEAVLAGSLDDMLEYSRKHLEEVQKGALPGVGDGAAEAEKPFELAGYERVRSRLFDGVEDYGKNGKREKKKSIGGLDVDETAILLGGRERKERTVMVGNQVVLREVSACERWEAVATFASGARTDYGDKLKEPAKKRKKSDFEHEEAHVKRSEDCLPEDEDLQEIGDDLPQFVELGYMRNNQSYYIQCGPCVRHEDDAAEGGGASHKHAKDVEMSDAEEEVKATKTKVEVNRKKAGTKKTEVKKTKKTEVKKAKIEDSKMMREMMGSDSDSEIEIKERKVKRVVVTKFVEDTNNGIVEKEAKVKVTTKYMDDIDMDDTPKRMKRMKEP